MLRKTSAPGLRNLSRCLSLRCTHCGIAPHVIDIRNFGLMGAIELAPRPGAPGARGMDAHVKCFEQGLMVRHGMDTLAFSPFLTFTPDLLERTFDTVRGVLDTVD